MGNNKDLHYKYWIYLTMNPNLSPSPFLNRIDAVGKCLTKFRVGSHHLKIETGRWSRVPRNDRLCTICGVLGDESHVVYTCSEIRRDDIAELPQPLSEIWNFEGINTLFKRIVDAKYLE